MGAAGELDEAEDDEVVKTEDEVLDTMEDSELWTEEDVLSKTEEDDVRIEDIVELEDAAVTGTVMTVRVVVATAPATENITVAMICK